MLKEIILTPQGGFFYRAMTFHWITVTIFFIPAFCLLLTAVVNPFWFRDSFFNWCERLIAKFSQWRNYQKYRIYLGCDPRVWHGLKDSHE